VDEQTILFFVEPTEAKVQDDGARSSRDTGAQFGGAKQQLLDRLQGTIEVPVDRLKHQVKQLVGLVTTVFDQAEYEVEHKQPNVLPENHRQLHLEEIELTVELNAEGQLGILGSGGKAGGKSGIKLKFMRK
jgi:hypothetical protein